MKLRELEIERFGVWRDVEFPFNEGGVTVLYGPNEAGKSTLMRCIRGILYGYPAQEERGGGPHFRLNDCAASLKLRYDGQEFALRRVSQTGTRGRLEINGRAARDDDPLLRNLIGETPESLFQNVFAIGLHELQQLATLQGDDVADRLYSLSLGPEGQQIFRAQSGFSDEELRLVSPGSRGGELLSSLAELEQLDRELARRGPAMQRHAQLQSDLTTREQELQGEQRRQSDLQHELRGRQLMTRIWDPWKKEQDLRRQLDRLPCDDVDREILNRFDELEIELSEVDDRRKTLIEDAKRLQAQAERIQTRPELEEQACAIRMLFEKTRSMQALERTISEPSHTRDHNRLLGDVQSKLGGRWDRTSLEQVDLSPAGLSRMMQFASAYRSAARQRSRLIRKYKRGAAALRQLEGHRRAPSSTRTPAATNDLRDALRQRLHELEELRGLRVRREHLKRTVELFAKAKVEQRGTPRELPPFFWLVLWFFIPAGVILMAAGAYAAFRGYEGLVAGGPAAWIVGACFAFLGVSVMGITWGMKEYFEAIDFRPDESSVDRRSLEHELHRTEQAIDRIVRRDTLNADMKRFAIDPSLSEEDQMGALRQQLAEIDRHEPEEVRAARLRRTLSKMRRQLQERQRLMGRARRDWTDALKRMGLSESLKVSEAFEKCQLIADAQGVLREDVLRDAREEQQRRELETFLRQVDELGQKIMGPTHRVRDRYQALAEWERELTLLAERRKERTQLRQTAKEQRREAAGLAERIKKMRVQRSNLLKRLGAGNRGEIALKLAAIDERAELEKKLRQVQESIAQAVSSDPDLAIVEDDLLAYDPTRNQQAISELKSELSAIGARLQSGFEAVGSIKQELRDIEDDRSLTSLRFDREQVMHAVREATESLCAVRLANRVVSSLRQRIEKERQPRLLNRASQFLQRLTCDKYRNIWTPLGEKALLVDDDQGQSLRVEQLSSGAREQVFLSVRMAMIREFAQQGVELPMILDDVTVNFDQVRTDAAVQTLADLASQGQQILLFTCHLHLAQRFEALGLEPIWLPAHRAEAQLQV